MLKNPSDTARAERRAHRARLMRARRRHWGQDLSGPDRRAALSKASRTPASCSCFMCGNPRRYFDEPTMPERRAFQEPCGKLDDWAAYREERRED